MAKGLIRFLLALAICLGLWLTLWSLKPKVSNRERIIGQFHNDGTLTAEFSKPAVKQVDFFLWGVATSAAKDASVVIAWSLLAEGHPVWFTNRVDNLILGTNRINLTGPGNIVLVRSITSNQPRTMLNVRVSGPEYFRPLSMGIQWMEVRRFYDP